jgi:glycosyltransferase involved in cell wall biosynthesis
VAAYISVIIATRDRQRLLGETLDALAGQSWPPGRGEIIVADNGSTDGTRAVVEAAAARTPGLPIHYLYVALPGKSAAVNAALQHARGDVLAFTDDDVLPEPEWLERLAESFAEPEVDFVAGRIFPRWEAPAPPWMSPALYGVLAVADGGDARLRIRAGAQEHPMTIGANMAVRASVVRRLGGLRPDLGKLEGTLRTGEDHEFFLRMLHGGCQGVYAPAAVVRHFVPRARLNRAYFRAWLYQNGQDVARLERAYPGKRRLLGIPRYLWRAAADDVVGAARAAAAADAPVRFAAFVRLIWLAGYLRASWFGAAHAAVGPAIPAVAAGTSNIVADSARTVGSGT